MDSLRWRRRMKFRILAGLASAYRTFFARLASLSWPTAIWSTSEIFAPSASRHDLPASAVKPPKCLRQCCTLAVIGEDCTQAVPWTAALVARDQLTAATVDTSACGP